MFFMWSWYAGRVALEPVRRRRRRRSAARRSLWASGLVLLACAVAAGGALLLWPHPRVELDGEALAHLVQPGYAGRVSSVVVRRPDGSTIPVRIRQGRVWPETPLVAGEPLRVELTVRRPGWAGWLVGRTARTSRFVRTPSARLRGRWLEIRTGEPVVATFETPVRTVVLREHGHARTLRFARGRRAVDVGVVAAGRQQVGSVSVSAVPRAWEKLPKPTRLSWFPVRRLAQALVAPSPGVALAPDRSITLTFSRPVRTIFGTSLPTVSPATPGRWHRLDTHTLSASSPSASATRWVVMWPSVSRNPWG